MLSYGKLEYKMCLVIWQIRIQNHGNTLQRRQWKYCSWNVLYTKVVIGDQDLHVSVMLNDKVDIHQHIMLNYIHTIVVHKTHLGGEAVTADIV